MSLRFSNSAHAATDAGEPLTSSPMTRPLEEGDPSATRTTLTSAPFADNPSDNAALNVASPHGVGGCVLRMPIRGGREKRCAKTGAVDNRRVGRAFKVIPTESCHRRVRRERMLAEISGERLTHPGLAGFPTPLTVHPRVGPGGPRWRRRPVCYVWQPHRGKVRASGPTRPPMIKGPVMADKSPRQSMTKKSGKSLKEKRAAKHAKAARASATEALLHDKKR